MSTKQLYLVHSELSYNCFAIIYPYEDGVYSVQPMCLCRLIRSCFNITNRVFADQSTESEATNQTVWMLVDLDPLLC